MILNEVPTMEFQNKTLLQFYTIFNFTHTNTCLKYTTSHTRIPAKLKLHVELFILLEALKNSHSEKKLAIYRYTNQLISTYH